MRLVNKPYIVYALRDPRNKQIRYIGVTSRLLHLRLSHHIADSHHEFEAIRKYGNKYKSSACPRIKWITELRMLGLKPIISPLDTTLPQYAESLEKAWIRFMVSLGCDLVNEEAKWIKKEFYAKVA